MTTRRSFIRAGAGLAAIIASGRAPAAFIRSMIAARNGFAAGGGGKLDYVMDGLICRFSGKDNGGLGVHNASISKWVNLGSLGAAYNATRTSAAPCTADGIVLTNDLPFQVPSSVWGQMRGEWTVEVLFAPDTANYVNYHGLFGDHRQASGTYPGLVGGQYEDGLYVMFIWAGSVGDICGTKVYSSSVPVGAKTSMTFSVSQSRVISAGYLNGKRLTSSSAEVAYTLALTSSKAQYVNVSRRSSLYPFCIGAAFAESYDVRAFRGTMHDLRIYNRCITDEEVAQNYQADKSEYLIV